MWHRFKILLGCVFLLLIPSNAYSTIEIFDPLGRKVDSFHDRETSYEDDMPIVEGFIVLADPADACTAIEGPTFLTNFTMGKFVLINGTDMCGFKRKVKNAEIAGFDFAVIFDPSSAPIEYIHFGKCIKSNQDGRRKSWRNRLSNRQIKQIPTAKFANGDQYDICAICLADYNVRDKLRILPCSHAYHAKCIDPWLMNNRRNCPLCKRKITFGDSEDDSDSEDLELTSAAENTPLLISPTNHSETWGTFVQTIPNRAETNGAGPSSVPDSCQSATNSLMKTLLANALENPFISDSKSENLLPPPNLSINNNKKIGNASNNEFRQISFAENPFVSDSESENCFSSTYDNKSNKSTNSSNIVVVEVDDGNSDKGETSANSASVI